MLQELWETGCYHFVNGLKNFITYVFYWIFSLCGVTLVLLGTCLAPIIISIILLCPLLLLAHTGVIEMATTGLVFKILLTISCCIGLLFYISLASDYSTEKETEKDKNESFLYDNHCMSCFVIAAAIFMIWNRL